MKIYETILSIVYKLLLNDNRFKYYKQLRRNLKLNRETIISIQNRNIQKLVTHAYNNTKYYKELFDNLGLKPEDIRTNKDIAKLPPLTKSTIKANIENLKSNDEYGKNLIKVTSGGSSGILSIIYKSSIYEQISRASWLRNNSIVGWFPSAKSVWIWGSPIENKLLKNSILTRVSIKVNRRVFLNAYKYEPSNFSKWVEKIKKFKPKVVYGYASIILELSKYLLKNNISFPSIKIVITTSEKLEERELIEKAFRCNVYDQYGCREVLAVSIEQQKDKMILTDDVVLLNLNEANEFLLTPLYSFGFPLINYKVGDIGSTSSDSLIDLATTGLPYPEIKLKIGRITDNFINSQNMMISTSALSTYLSTFDLNLIEYQIIQVDVKTFYINYISKNDSNLSDTFDIITKTLEKYFSGKLNIKFFKVTKIPLEESGKRLLFKRTFKV